MNTYRWLVIAFVSFVAASCGPVEPSAADIEIDVSVVDVADVGSDAAADTTDAADSEGVCSFEANEETQFVSTCAAMDSPPYGDPGFPEYKSCHFGLEVPILPEPSPLTLRHRQDWEELLNPGDDQIDVDKESDHETNTFSIDLDEDGNTDILSSRAVCSQEGDDSCRVFFGVHMQEADGTMGEFQELQDVWYMQPLPSINDDPIPDFVWLDGEGSLSIRHGDPEIPLTEAGFQSSVLPGFEGYLSTVSAFDLDKDGQIDVFTPRSGAADLLYYNNGDGTFTEISEQAAFVRNPEFGDVFPIANHDPFFVYCRLEDPFDATSAIVCSVLVDGTGSHNSDYRCEVQDGQLSCPLTDSYFDVECDIKTAHLYEIMLGVQLNSVQLHDLGGIIMNMNQLDSIVQAHHAGHGPTTPTTGGGSDPMGVAVDVYANALVCETYTQTGNIGHTSTACFDRSAYERGEPAQVPVYTLNTSGNVSTGNYELFLWGIDTIVDGSGLSTRVTAHGKDYLAGFDPNTEDVSCHILQEVNTRLSLGFEIECPELGDEYGNGYIGFTQMVADADTGSLDMLDADVRSDRSLDGVDNFAGISKLWIENADESTTPELLLVYETFYGYKYVDEVVLNGNVARIRVHTYGENSTPYDCTGCVITTNTSAGLEDGPHAMNMAGINIGQGNWRGEVNVHAGESDTVDVWVQYPDGYVEFFAAVPANMRLQTLRRGEGEPA